MMATSCNQCTAARGKGFAAFPSLALTSHITSRQRIGMVKVLNARILVYNSKKANLSAAKKERIKLPSLENGCRIREFFSHPLGIQAVLNVRSLQSFESLDTNTFRCILPSLQLLNFEAAPVLDLRVTPMDGYCTVEMLSCKFQGSEVVERQNDHFSAFMMNYMTWNTDDSDPFLEVDVKLNLTLEIYTQPFTLLPTSAVEVPGNLMMQALVDRFVPLLVEQLIRDYTKWVKNQQIKILDESG